MFLIFIFNLQKGIAKSTLQPQGVLGAVRSPFHAILSLLRPNNGELSTAFERQPNLVVASTKLIYNLCSNMATFEVTLRFLRSSEDFFCTQISMMPFANVQATAWILKAAAIGKKHALKKYDHFTINTSCFFRDFVL